LAEATGVTAKAQRKESAFTPNPALCGVIPVSAIARGERRLEGESYLATGYGIRTLLEGGSFPFLHLRELARVWQPSRLKGIIVSAEHGIPFLTPNQVFDLRPAVRKWLSSNHTPDLPLRFLEPGWILVTCSGNGMAQNVGKVLASYSAHEKAIVSHDLLRLQMHSENDFGLLYAFLRSRFGRAMLSSSQYGGVIKHLEPKHVEPLPIPNLSSSIRASLDVRIRQVFSLRDAALQLTVQAENAFLNALNISSPNLEEEKGYIVPSSQLSAGRRRLDAHHFNPKARAILRALQKTGCKLTPLRKLVSRIFVPGRFKHVYVEHGTPYLDSEDIYKVNPDITKFVVGLNKNKVEQYKVKKDWLLMACSGQVYGINGTVVLANEWHEGKILSNHIMRIVPDPDAGVRRGYLQMALGHPSIGRPLILRWAFGSGVPEISPEDILDVPIVRLARRDEDEIATMVERASELRLLADRIENEAILELETHVAKSVLRVPHSQPVGAVDESAPQGDANLDEQRRWHEYLAKALDGRLIPSHSQLKKTLELWARIRAEQGNVAVLPITTPMDDGVLNLAWNTPEQYLEVAISADGRLQWFYRHSKANLIEGTDDELLDVVPTRVYELLRQLHPQPA
jgi:hypothetical protein